jgi:hypothetical protein
VLKNAVDQDLDLTSTRRAILEAQQFVGTREIRALGMAQFMSLQFPPRQFMLKPWLTTTGAGGQGKTLWASAAGLGG